MVGFGPVSYGWRSCAHPRTSSDRSPSEPPNRAARSRSGPSRVIHFFPAANEKMRSKVPDIAPTVDILLANLEDGVPADQKEAARAGLIEVATAPTSATPSSGPGSTASTRRGASTTSPPPCSKPATPLDVIMIPKVEGPEDIHYVDRLLAQLEAKAGLDRPILVHAILETARGVANVEEICGASPRMQGLSLGPADLAANRRMKTTRVGGGHPGYLVRNDPPAGADGPDVDADRATYQQDLWHYTIARMVDACVTHGILPFYGPFGDIADTVACEDQFRNAYLLGCVGAWSLHPAQIAIAKRVFSPDPADVAHAQRVIEAMGDGTGAVLLDGKMEDDASVKQCQVIVALARAARRSRPRTRRDLRTRVVTAVPDDHRRPAPAPLRALHAGGQRAGAREGPDDPGRRDHLRPRRRRRARRQARCPGEGGRRRPVRALRQPRADDPLQRARHRVGRRRHRRRRTRPARPPS